MGLTGKLAIATVNDNTDTPIYTAIKLGDVNVTSNSGSDKFGLTGTISIDYYHSNSAANGYDRLDWTTAFADGALLNPGSYLPTPVDLTIDYTSDFHYRVAGRVTGTETNNTILTAGDVSVTGTAQFAVSKYDRDLGTLTESTLNSYAFTIDGGFSVGPAGAETVNMGLTGKLAIATVNDNTDTPIYTAIKLGDVNVTSNSGSDKFGLTGTISIDYYHSNSAANGYDRLDWTTAFADGALLNPGSYLPTPVDLTIDYTSDFHYRVAGRVTGTETNNTILTAGDVSVTGTAQFAVSKYDRDLGTLTESTLNSYAFTIDGGFSVGPAGAETVNMGLTGKLAIATVNDNTDTPIYTAIKLGDVNVTSNSGSDKFGLTGTISIDYYHSNSAANGYDRLDWTTAFADGALLNPGSYLPTPVDLTIDYTSDFHYRVAGRVTGTETNNTILTAGDVSVTGTAQFAVSKYDRDLGTLTESTLNSYAFTIDGGFSVGPAGAETVNMGLTGKLAIATVNDNTDTPIYTAIKLGDVNVTSNSGSDKFGLTGTISIDYYHSNSAANGYDRLDWTTAFADGALLNPGSYLPTPVDLTIDYTSDFHYRVAGRVTGTETNNTILTAGDVSVTGTAQFAVSKYDRDLGTLTESTLNSYAFTIDGGFSVGPAGAETVNMGLTGKLAIATVNDNTDTPIYTAIKLGDVNVTSNSGSDKFGLTGTISIDYYHSNSAANGYDRLDWTTAFADGALLNPGSYLPTPVDLTIDYTSDFHYRVAGSVSGNGAYDPTPAALPSGDELTEVLIRAGPVTISGRAGFALTRSTTDVDTDGLDGADLFGATLDQVALTVTGAVVNVNGVATLTVSGGLALARVTPAGGTTARYTALKMGDVTVSASTADASDFGLSGTLTIDGLGLQRLRRHRDRRSGAARLEHRPLTSMVTGRRTC